MSMVNAGVQNDVQKTGAGFSLDLTIVEPEDRRRSAHGSDADIKESASRQAASRSSGANRPSMTSSRRASLI